MKVAKCANGCDAPVKAPSRVLCAKCLEALSKKMHKILGGSDARTD